MNDEPRSRRGSRTRGTRPAAGRSWTTALFGAPFLAFALGVLVLAVVPAAIDAWQMRSWTEIRGTLEALEVRESDGTTGIDARYRYALDGERFTATRVAVFDMRDNIGPFQRDLAERLQRARADGKRVPVWFDPDDPSRATLDRTVRWGLFAFLGGFALAFGAIGGGLVFVGLRSTPTTARRIDADTHPWRLRAAWQGGPIRSHARGTAWAATAFALVWNALSWTAVLAARAQPGETPLGAIAMLALFPLVGLLTLAIAWRRITDWRRHGATPLTLSPFPGTLGERVTGRIALGASVPPGTPLTLTLDAARHVRRGRNLRTEPIAQRRREAVSRAGHEGAFVDVALEAPARCPESDAIRSGERVTWTLSLDAPAVGLRRVFEVPVYRDRGHRVGEASSRSGDAIDEAVPDDVGHEPIAHAVPFARGRAHDEGPVELDHGWRHGKVGPAIVAVIGVAFAAAGTWIALDGSGFLDRAFGLVFGGTGALLGAFSLRELGTTRRVRIDRRGIEIHVRRFGVPGRPRRLASARIDALDIARSGSMSGTNGIRLYYRVFARTVDGERVDVAWWVEGEIAAQAVAERFARALHGEGDERDDGERPEADGARRRAA